METYEPLEIIGTGSFGLIRKILARKEIDYRRMNDKEKQQLVSEVNIIRELKHPNIKTASGYSSRKYCKHFTNAIVDMVVAKMIPHQMNTPQFSIATLNRIMAKSPPALICKIKTGKISPLPPQYSEELNRVVKAMLEIDREDELNCREEALRIREEELNSRIKRHEEELNSRIKQREEEVNSIVSQREEELNYRETVLCAREEELNSRIKQRDEFNMLLAAKEEELRNGFSELQLLKEQFEAEVKHHTEKFNMEVERQREELKIEFLELQRIKEEHKQKENVSNENVANKEELKCSFLEFQRQKSELKKTRDATLRENVQTINIVDSSCEVKSKDGQQQTEIRIPPLKRTLSDIGTKPSKRFQQELQKNKPRKLIFRTIEPLQSASQNSIVSNQIPQKRLRTEQEVALWDPNDDDAPSPFIKEKRLIEYRR
ncbi:15665_t:CDS:2 [Acaulospora colombiana]|uniref:15665_t:CDS:1 n=1 Tax=Acaulospora colombiana TaxID=27376 RepID=A0ACA9LKA0_9GLOM|nr:15665_t:CDS:2 [Acaulospora colombiana]